MTTPVRVNDLLHLKEPDYCYGVGDLVLRVTGIGNPSPGTEWLEIMGHEIDVNGIQGRERHVSVRVDALRGSRTHQNP
jgi:hypothetical protein